MRQKKPDKAIISLDIGRDSLKMIKGMKDQDKLCVLDFACRKFSAHETTTEVFSQNINELLTSVVDAKRIKKSRIYSTISGRKLCIRVVKLPVMPEAELYQALRSKIRKFVSSDLDQLIFSFSVLGEIEEKGIKKLEVVFVAIQRTLFDEYLQFFKLTGTQPRVITSACFCGWNLIREIGLDKGAASVMLINIEDQETDLSVYRAGRFVFTRNISIGGKDFTDRQTRELLPSEADMLCKEIELTVHHYYQITHGRKIDKSIVLGGASGVSGLIDFLRQKLEITVETLHIPEAKLQLPPEKKEAFKRDLPLYTQGLGTLLVGPDDINLVARVRAQTKKTMRPTKFFALPKTTAAAVIVFISLALGLLAFFKGINLYYRHQIKSYKMRREKLEERTFELVDIKRKADILALERELYLRLIKEYPAYSLVIAQICQAIPSQRVVLDEISFSSSGQRAGSAKGPQAAKFTLNGSVLGKGAATAEITAFMLALEKSGYFENISVAIKKVAATREPRQQQDRELNFVIDGSIRTDIK